MKFRTEITITDAPRNLSPERLVLLAGSCFSDNIGSRMSACGWPCIANPCGTIYNPVSMALLFQLALTQRAVRREIVLSSITTLGGATLSRQELRYVSWFMGSKASGATPEECIDKVCESLDRLEEGIETSHAIILTFGTSDVWLLAGTDRAVGNCHKHPAAQFEKKRVEVDEIADLWLGLTAAISDRRGDAPEFIFTISPRRYLSDGFEANTRQKAVLALACEKLVAGCSKGHYFPAYEIFNDDLRDYRYYSKDLVHPSEMGIDYVWEKFTGAYLQPDGLEKLRIMEKEARRSLHIPVGLRNSQ